MGRRSEALLPAAPPGTRATPPGSDALEAVPVEAVLFDLGDTLIEEAATTPREARDPILPGVRRTLGELAPQYRMGVLSNTRSATRVEIAQLLGELGIARHFQAIVTSSDIGWRKPHPLAFEAALAAVGARAERTVMVGNDLEADVAGAKAMGLRTVHFCWSPRYRLDPHGPQEEATVTISEFDELPVALERAHGHPVPRRTAVVRPTQLYREGLPDAEGEEHAVRDVR